MRFFLSVLLILCSGVLKAELALNNSWFVSVDAGMHMSDGSGIQKNVIDPAMDMLNNEAGEFMGISLGTTDISVDASSGNLFGLSGGYQWSNGWIAQAGYLQGPDHSYAINATVLFFTAQAAELKVKSRIFWLGGGYRKLLNENWVWGGDILLGLVNSDISAGGTYADQLSGLSGSGSGTLIMPQAVVSYAVKPNMTLDLAAGYSMVTLNKIKDSTGQVMRLNGSDVTIDDKGFMYRAGITWWFAPLIKP